MSVGWNRLVVWRFERAFKLVFVSCCRAAYSTTTF